MVAAYKRDHAAAKALINAGANLNALDNDRYDLRWSQKIGQGAKVYSTG